MPRKKKITVRGEKDTSAVISNNLHPNLCNSRQRTEEFIKKAEEETIEILASASPSGKNKYIKFQIILWQAKTFLE